ncbi:DUF1203 domain-containing protein [Hoeflea sp.]|uniref:DUF1203 domain-containing protein n=1 Tax=Hoeflea sp. TaxID=1940281 RepID=UPI003BB1FB09
MQISFEPMNEPTADHFRNGGADSYGNAPEHAVSDGKGVPCRRCMKMVARDEPYLVLAWRPFSRLHAYAETGPVFVHAETCAPGTQHDDLPPFLESPDYILRAYDNAERIIYGTGGVVDRADIRARLEQLLADPGVESVHIRSSRNNCYHCKAVRGAMTAL